MTSTLQTLESLLDRSEDYLLEFDSPEELTLASEQIVFMDTKDISNITAVSSPQIPSSPTAFLGHTLPEIRDWFDENITQPESEIYMPYCFLVLDDKTVEDDSCIFVCTNNDSAPGEIQSVRCTFDVVMANVIACDVKGETIDDDTMGEFFRSGVTMTKENVGWWWKD